MQLSRVRLLQRTKGLQRADPVEGEALEVVGVGAGATVRVDYLGDNVNLELPVVHLLDVAHLRRRRRKRRKMETSKGE